LQKVVKSSYHQGTLAKGLHEVCKALEVTDAGKAKFCVLAENCDE
jgi:small subunit ribosomal protein S12e